MSRGRGGKPCVDHLGRQFSSTTAMCKEWDIDPSTYTYRAGTGMNTEEALTTELHSFYRNDIGEQFPEFKRESNYVPGKNNTSKKNQGNESSFKDKIRSNKSIPTCNDLNKERVNPDYKEPEEITSVTFVEVPNDMDKITFEVPKVEEPAIEEESGEEVKKEIEVSMNMLKMAKVFSFLSQVYHGKDMESVVPLENLAITIQTLFQLGDEEFERQLS